MPCFERRECSGMVGGSFLPGNVCQLSDGGSALAPKVTGALSKDGAHRRESLRQFLGPWISIQCGLTGAARCTDR